jgi:hypothetical protein
MMMKMLEAGGLTVMTDAIRQADIDNPKGYYEYERVKHLEKETDKSYVREARGKVLKVISFLLKDLPEDNFYRVIFMRRHLGRGDRVAEQDARPARRGVHRGPRDDGRGVPQPSRRGEDPRPQAPEPRDARVPLRRGGEEPEGGRALGQRLPRGGSSTSARWPR